MTNLRPLLLSLLCLGALHSNADENITAQPISLLPDELQITIHDNGDFGSTKFGTPVTQSAVVTYVPVNKSAVSAVIGKSEISTSDIIVCLAIGCPEPSNIAFKIVADECAGKTLSSGQSCKLSLSFVGPNNAPTVKTSYLARLRVPGERKTSTGSNSIEARLNLSGTIGVETASSKKDVERVFDWAEARLPLLLKPLLSGSMTARCYKGLCLAEQNGKLYMFNGESLVPLKQTVADILPEVTKDGF